MPIDRNTDDSIIADLKAMNDLCFRLYAASKTAEAIMTAIHRATGNPFRLWDLCDRAEVNMVGTRPPPPPTPGVKTYLHKPIVVQAILWTGDNLADVDVFTGGKVRHETLQRVVGEYVVRLPEGDFLPIKADLFMSAYCEDTFISKYYEEGA